MAGINKLQKHIDENTAGEPGFLAELRRDSFNCLNELENLPAEVDSLLESGQFFPVDKIKEPSLALDGVEIMSLQKAVSDREDILREYFLKTADDDSGWQRLLHGSIWQSGYLIVIEPGAVLDEPLVIPEEVYNESGFSTQHLLIVAGAGSEAQLLRFSTPPDSGRETVDLGMTEIFAAPNSNIYYSRLCRGGERWSDYSLTQTQVDRDAKISVVSGRPGGVEGAPQLRADLIGKHAEFQSRQAQLIYANQKLYNRVEARHRAEKTNSDMLVRGVCSGLSEGFFEGIVDMGANSPGSRGALHERVLMINSRAEADALPVLRVDNNDVKAAHSASVGEIDREKLFYLQTRGFDIHQAKRLIIEGFFEFMLENVRCPAATENLRKMIKDRLDDIDV